MQARRAREPRLFSLATGLMHFAFLQILLGALVAGIDAGRNYIDWPLMAGQVFPPDPFQIEPWWRNFFENDGLVQFIHRMAGYLLFVFGLVAWRRGRRSPHAVTRRAFDRGGGDACCRSCSASSRCMNSAPWQIAIVHQLGAVALWTLILRGAVPGPVSVAAIPARSAR